MIRKGLFTVAVAVMALPAAADSYGKLEHVKVIAITPIEIVAKLDPGAEGSSLDAVNVKYFQRNGDTWVRFTVDNGSVVQGKRVTLERPVLKDLKMRQKGGGVEHRPVVEIELCVGDHSIKTKLSVADRRGFTAPLVIGPEGLAELGSVDPARQFTHEPNCRQSEAAQLPEAGVPNSPESAASPTASPSLHSGAIVKFRCDGRTMCAQMQSCEEARFFLDNCPGVKMDGDRNGIPCEKQWCH